MNERNIIQIRHGDSQPSDGALFEYELGYCREDNSLYIGIPDPNGTGVISKRILRFSGDGALILNKSDYGSLAEMPTNPVEGQVYFLEVTDNG